MVTEFTLSDGKSKQPANGRTVVAAIPKPTATAKHQATPKSAATPKPATSSKRDATSLPAATPKPAAAIDQIAASPATDLQPIAASVAETPRIAAPLPEAPKPAAALGAATDGAEDFFEFGRTALGALADSQTAMARGIEAVALEAAAFARSGLSAAADAASALLGARTLADAMEIQAGFARRSIDAALDGSARLSEIAVKTTAEASRPILSRLDDTWRGIA